jgi:hypothetical protein
MDRYRTVMPRLRLSKRLGVIVTAFALCVITTVGSGAGMKGSPGAQFTLKAIPASAVHHGGQVPRIRNANGTSSNWSGYAIVPNPTNATQNVRGKGNGNGGGKPSGGSSPAFNDVTGSWVVPAVSAGSSASTYSSTWVGLDGYNTTTVEQIGTEQDWSNGGPAYYAWFEMYPKGAYEIVGFPVNPGDAIFAEVATASKGEFTLTIMNATEDVTFSTTQRSQRAQRQSAEWVVEAPWWGGVLPLADFGTIDLFDCYAAMDNGSEGSIDGTAWRYDPITMETSNGTIKAEPSGLTSGGTAFSVSWGHE